MSDTAAQIIEDAFQSIQVYNPGEIILPADMARGFKTLNDMLESWSNESLTTYATLEQSLTFVPGTYQYTIGPGAMIDSVRPIRLTHGFGTAYVLDQTANRYPLEVITRDRWNQIGNILRVNANVPLYLWYDPQMPWGVLNFYPIPNIGWQAFFDSFLQLARFDDLTVEISLPVGYSMALKRNLALELGPYYPNAVISPRLIQAAENSKANVKRSNFRETIARYDPEIVSRSKASYNIYTDRDGP